MHITYTGRDTAKDFKLAVIAEITRRADRAEQHSTRARTAKESARYAGEISALRALIVTFEQMQIDCNNQHALDCICDKCDVEGKYI